MRHRLFFALWPDPVTRTKLVDVRDRAGIIPAYQQVDGNLHLTIAFLGLVDTSVMQTLINAAATITCRRFKLIIDRSGWWEESHIIWLAPGTLPIALSEIHDSVTRLASTCGVIIDSRAYLPHITLLRNVNDRINIQFEPIHWHVTEFGLVESIPHSGYTEYQIIKRWALT